MVEDHSTLITAALLGAAAIVGAVLKPVFDFFKGRRNGNGKVDEIHQWLSPNQDGIQPWKGHEIKSAIDRARSCQERNFAKIHSANERIEKALEKQTHATIEGVNQIVKAVKEGK